MKIDNDAIKAHSETTHVFLQWDDNMTYVPSFVIKRISEDKIQVDITMTGKNLEPCCTAKSIFTYKTPNPIRYKSELFDVITLAVYSALDDLSFLIETDIGRHPRIDPPSRAKIFGWLERDGDYTLLN